MFNTGRRTVSAIVMSSFLLAGCSSGADKISATYVSPLEYYDYDCRQIRAELSRVSRRVSEITGQQNSEATKDAWAMGVGLVVFWPALFFLIGDDKKEELGRLKGEYEALESAAIQKNCDYAPTLMEAKQKREEEEAKRKAEEEAKKKESGYND